MSVTATAAKGFASSAGSAPPRRTGRVGAMPSPMPMSRNDPDVVRAVFVVRLATSLPWDTVFSTAVTPAPELDVLHSNSFRSFVRTLIMGTAGPPVTWYPPRTSATSGRSVGTVHRRPLRPNASTLPSSQRTTA